MTLPRGTTASFPIPAAPADRVPLEGETIYSRGKIADYKIDPDTGCWVWQKFILRGYPASGRTKPHRLYWMRANGREIPPGYHIHHKCHNTACVNPDHLEPREHAEHVREHQLALKTKLTWEQATEIRERVAAGDTTFLIDMAKEYGVHRTHIEMILSNRAFVVPYLDPTIWKPIRYCPRCGEQVSPEKNRHARFCTKRCQLKWNQEKKRSGKHARASVTTAQR